MSQLTLIRHGQASFFEANYDRLSPTGEQQSRALGAYWARRSLRLDEIYHGPRVRHRRSAELAVESCRANGHPSPDPVLLPGLDEYDLTGLLRLLLPHLCEQDATFAERVERLKRAPGNERLIDFQTMFEPLLLHWQSGVDLRQDMESWPAFCTRVDGVIRNLQQQGARGRRIALFTSGGFIGRATQLALAAPDRTALELHWRIRNGSLTEFAFTQERFTLDNFNTVPHLDDPALWTYR